MGFTSQAASQSPAGTLDLLLVYKAVLFPLVIPRCKHIHISSSGQIFPASFVPVSRLTTLASNISFTPSFIYFSSVNYYERWLHLL